MTNNKAGSRWLTIKRRRLLVAVAVLVVLALLFASIGGEKAYKRHAEFGRPCAEVLAISDNAKAKCVTLYYGTTRTPKRSKIRGDDGGFSVTGGFGNKFDNTLHLGRAQVVMPYLVSDLYPEGRKRGVVDHATDGPPRGKDATEHFVSITTISKTAEKRVFVDNLREAVAGNNKSILMFIHGYNVDFDSAVVRSAQLAMDLGFNENAPPAETFYELGQPVLFSWPNGGAAFTYIDDRRLAKKSAAHLRSFFDLLTEESGADVLNIVVHSMGNRVLVNAITDFARDYTQASGDGVTIRIIHAAADVDQDVYDRTMDEVERTSFRAGYTVYASKEDTALQTSTMVNALTSLFRYRRGRLGQIGENGIYVRKHVTSIDATGFATDLFGHGYFAEAGNVINDIACNFHGVDLTRRALAPRRQGDMPYYEIDSSRFALCLPGHLNRFAQDADAYAQVHAAAVAKAKAAGVYDAMSSQMASLAGESIFDLDCSTQAGDDETCVDTSGVDGGDDGGALPPAPSPSPPPALPAPPPAMQEAVIFFEFNHAGLSLAAMQALQSLLAEIADRKIARIIIEGHADAAGGEALNQDLSVLRADAVRAYLTAHGVTRDLIFIRGFGETSPAQPTADGERNPANRRARIAVLFDE
ncbi:MAG: alpha/beta hydrolase [Parvularculaceae bacterium]|nr:alpha/beta hydrolase [Parvularculaceae bacterium]